MNRGRRERAGRSRVRTSIPVVLAGSLVVATAVHATPAQAGPATTTITLTSEHIEGAGAANGRQLLSYFEVRDVEPGAVSRRLVAVPECDAAIVEAIDLDGLRLPAADAARLAWVEDVVHIRDQAVAVVVLDPGAVRAAQANAGRGGKLSVIVSPVNPRGPVSTNAGPFTGVCSRTILNYDASGQGPASWSPPRPDERRRGTAAYCYSVEDCAAAGTDVLFVVAQELFSSPALLTLANHDASYLGLNVSIVGTSALSDLSAEGLHQFIADVYGTQSAAHFGDGHLGFVQLVGDAYADDNATVMMPTYDGYGGTEVASDHFYACVSGDDEYEDVMIGRLSVGNESELASVVEKTTNYVPQSGESWTRSTLLVAGLFYTIKDDYVALFDEYEELMPPDWNVDRIYRHDYENNHQCSLDVVQGFNDGHLFVNYAGDGWISEWYKVMDTSDIPLMNNGDRLPIVLSMACMTGWYDNTTDVDQTGSYDCFAEQIVNAEGRGAVACLAAPRASDGGMFRTLTEQIYRAAFAEHCTFLGETISVAKLLHVQSGGEVAYARHFNLFGDPALIYRWESGPSSGPELAVRPHEIEVTPELPSESDDLTLTAKVRNMSAVPVSNVVVRVSDLSAAGSFSRDILIPHIGDWSFETITSVIPALPGAGHTLAVQVDPERNIDEIDETNNVSTIDVFVYPHVAGFPSEAGGEPLGPCLARLGQSGTHVLIIDNDARVRAIDSSGATEWMTDPGTPPIDYGPEIAPAVGDLDGDGINEIIATRRLAVAAFDSDGGQLWNAVTDDPIGSPVLADADADGDLDVLVATKMFFGGSSKIVAFDEDGHLIWSYTLPSGDTASATPVVGDFDMDGRADFAFGTTSGLVGAASCAETPPVELWSPVQLGTAPITNLALADIDGDEALEIAATGDEVFALNAEDGSPCWSIALDSTASAMAVGDIDADGVADVVAVSANGTVSLLADGTESWSVALPAAPAASIDIADVVDGEQVEIVILTQDAALHVLDGNGLQVVEPIPVPGSGDSSPYTADLTGDGRPEICIASDDGSVFAFGFEGTATEPRIVWQGQGGNPSRCGLLAQPFAGTITGSAILHGRYVITGDVVLESGSDVTILPETVLDFGASSLCGLEIRGHLDALGLPGAEILFDATNRGGQRSSWAGLDVKAGASVELSSCVISDAVVGIRGTGASINLDDCLVQRGSTSASFVNCELLANASGFTGADSLGMYLSGGSGSIADCTFSDNVHAGLTCSNYAGHEILRSSFTGTISGDGVRFYRHSDASVDSCIISDNNGHGALVHAASPAFNSCTISDNALDGVLCERLAAPTFCWNVITDNAFGVIAQGGAAPNLGNALNEDTGFNSIYDNSVAAVANYTDSQFPLEIRQNWWGSYPPAGRIFIGYVRYYPCLHTPPVQEPGGNGREEVVDDALIPSEFGLGYCSPNPFNPSTTVEFDVPANAGPVYVSVFDVAGRRVTTLYSGHHEPGTHTVTWDGRDDGGRNVASGIYFVRLNAEAFSASRKMVLLK